MTNTVYTLGYLQLEAMTTVQRLVSDGVMVLDIRFSPRSRRPQWSRNRLAERFGSAYLYVPELGNMNYRSPDLPVRFVSEVFGVRSVVVCLGQGHDVCLLCACADVAVCHRRVAADLVRAAYPCRVVHL